MRNINKIDKAIEETRRYMDNNSKNTIKCQFCGQDMEAEEVSKNYHICPPAIQIDSIQIFISISNETVKRFEEEEKPLSIMLCKEVEKQLNLPENKYTFEDCEFDDDDDYCAMYILTYSSL